MPVVHKSAAGSSAVFSPTMTSLWMNRRRHVGKPAHEMLNSSTSAVDAGLGVDQALAENNSATPARAGTPTDSTGTGIATEPPNGGGKSAESPEAATAATHNRQEQNTSGTGGSPAAAKAETNRSELPGAEDQARVYSYIARLRQHLTDQRMRARSGAVIEANMHLVRERQHPSQLAAEASKLMEQGVTREEQLHREARIAKFAAKGGQAKKPQKKKSAAAAALKERERPALPEWIPFKLRFKRANSDQVWNSILQRRGQLRKDLGGRAPAVVKETERYNKNVIELWTMSMTVRTRINSTLLDLLRPAFARLGLNNRADFRCTIGCFLGDTRQRGKTAKGVPTKL